MKEFFKPLYRGWMKFAHGLGWVNTRIILTLVYYLVFSPLAILFKIIGKDPMNRKIGSADTYWIERDSAPFDRERARRQF